MSDKIVCKMYVMEDGKVVDIVENGFLDKNSIKVGDKIDLTGNLPDKRQVRKGYYLVTKIEQTTDNNIPILIVYSKKFDT